MPRPKVTAPIVQARIAWENGYLLKQLAEHDGNITRTARAIGLDRSYLHKRLNQIGEAR